MLEVVLLVAVLLASIVLHENAHGVTALWLGDTTAKWAGRLTLNPLKHLDPFGSVVLPLMLALSTGTTFGFARPVPISPSKLRGGDRGFAIVALAGPVSNVILAFLAVTLLKIVGPAEIRQYIGLAPGFPCDMLPGLAAKASCYGFEVNLFLAAFNLVPIPPLDGSRLIRPLLRPRQLQTLDRVEPYGFLIVFGLIWLASEPFFRLVSFIASGILRVLPV